MTNKRGPRGSHRWASRMDSAGRALDRRSIRVALSAWQKDFPTLKEYHNGFTQF